MMNSSLLFNLRAGLMAVLLASLVIWGCSEDGNDKDDNTGDTAVLDDTETGSELAAMDDTETGSELAAMDDTETGSESTAMDDTETGSDSEVKSSPLAITGTYSDGYGNHVVTDDGWLGVYPGMDVGDDPSVSLAVIDSYDNEAQYLIAQNGDGSWSRYDWTVDDGDLYYCQIEYAAADATTARANTSADRAALATDGCAGFAWSVLTPVDALEIAGSYSDGYGSHTIDSARWEVVYPPMDAGSDPFVSVSIITSYDNEADYLVAVNEDGSWSRYDWTVDGGDLYYCQIEYAAADAATARANTSADRAALATDGCAGFPWSVLTAQ